MTTNRYRATLARLAAVVTAAVVGAAGFLAVGASPAAAAQNTGIVLHDAVLTHVDSTGQPITRDQVMVGDYVQFDVKYDATKADPKPGDSFSVVLPPSLVLRDTSVTKPLVTSAGISAGECALSNDTNGSTITCTFNDAIADKIEVKGSLSANLYVGAATDSNTVEIILNNASTSVELPYLLPIGVHVGQPWAPATNPMKYSSGVSSSSTTMAWFVHMPGAWLNAQYPSNEPVVVTDNLTAGVLFPSTDMSQFILREICADPSNLNSWVSREVARADGYSVDGFTYSVQVADTHNLTLTATGAWKDACDYTMELRTSFAGGAAIDPNVTYENTATFVNKDTVVTGSRKYEETFTGTIQYRDGYGGFQVIKTVTGDDAAAVENRIYTFTYACTDQQTGTLEVSAAGGSVTVDKEFPQGTECTITEGDATRDGYVWSGEQAKTVTIVAGVATAVEFVNTYTKATSPTSAPTTPAPSVPSPTKPMPSKPTLVTPKPKMPKTGS